MHNILLSKIQPQLFQNTISSNIPPTSDINIVDFMSHNKSASSSESYFEQWSKMVKLGVASLQKLSSSSSSDELQVKAKYFAAWRKYTLKKRKQQQQAAAAATGTTVATSTAAAVAPPKPPLLTHQISSSSESTGCTIKAGLSGGSFGEQFNYDLKSKWLKYCLFCPRSD